VTRCQRFLAAPVGGPADRPEQRRVGRTYLGSSHARSQRAAADKVGSCDVARVGLWKANRPGCCSRIQRATHRVVVMRPSHLRQQSQA
jgi:hypothetical protein